MKIKCLLFIVLIGYILSEEVTKTETCEGPSETCASTTNNIEKEPINPEKNKEEKDKINKEQINPEKNKEEKDKINKEQIKEEKMKEEIKKEEPKEELTKIINKKLIYSKDFLNQPLSLTMNATSSEETSTFFDFRINRKISNFVEENGLAPYPRERFVGKQQGNFLHFLHLVYKKKLPLFFSVDQIIYPYIEITKELQRRIMDKGLYYVMHQFLKNVIDYGKKENYEQGILLYFSVALKFLNRTEKVMHDEVCQKLIKKLLSIEKNATSTLYNFTLLNQTRRIDKLNFVQIYPILKGTDNLESISDCFRFLQNFEFVIEKELYNIYKIGHLIHKSGEEKTYREIKRFIKYIFNEEENVMNPLDIYLFIEKNYKNETATNVTINNLYKTIKDKIIKNTTLKFMSNYTFLTKAEEENFYKERNGHVSLFSYSYNLDEYINYKLLNFQRLRFYPSYFEYSDIVHHGKLMRKTIIDRYEGKNTSSTGKLFKFRDGINVTSEFKYVKKETKKSMKEENDLWIDSYENSFNYLLNIVGHHDKEMKEIEDIKIKTFNTLTGSFTHFKKDILLFEQYTNFTYCQNGEIIDLYFDPQLKFYEEIKKISVVFRNHMVDLLNLYKNETKKNKLLHYVERKMKRLFISYEKIIKGIELQENKINDEERKKIKDSMFYYDAKKKKYQGWYVDLYINQTGKIDYALKMYAYNYFMARPIAQVDFRGIIIYTSMNFPEFGLISIEENKNEPKKLYIFSSYTGNEYPHAWTDNVNYDGLKRLIVTRR